jgi:phytoene synthase
LCPGDSPLIDQEATVARDTSFYYSFLVLPQAKRDAIVAVWDFCRAVDDTVDEPGQVPPAEALASWRQELARCYEGTPETRQGRSLQPFIQQFNLPRQPFSDLIDGVEMDVSTCRYATFPALYEYCWRVASTVGLICIEIFGCTRPESKEYAINLGVGLQLTNIVRDIATDLERGRIYLPQDDLARFDVSEADLEAGRPVDRVQRLIAFECERAREYYRKAAALLPRDDAKRLVAAEIMAGIYREILSRVERANYDVFSSIIRVPRPRRAIIAATIWLRALAGFVGAS